MKIKSLTYIDDHGMDNTYTVGEYGVIEIIEHFSEWEGDKWYYDIIREKETIRMFNFARVTFDNQQ